jgi:hypothetical protein
VVDAGEHNLETRKPGFYTKSSLITLAGRDRVDVKLELVKVSEAQTPNLVATPTLSRAVSKEPNRTPALIGWSATGALALTAGITGYLAIKKANQLESMRSDYGVTTAQLDNAKHSASTLFAISDITTVAAAVAGGVSLYLTLSKPGEHPVEPLNPKSPAPQVSLGIEPSGVHLRGTF